MSASATPSAAHAVSLPTLPARSVQPAALGLAQALAELSAAGDAAAPAPAKLWRALVDAGLDALPPPAGGRTLQRWQALAAVAQHDLSLAKLYEGHTDALAILKELGEAAPPAGARIGMWAAEPPDGRITFLQQPDGGLRLRGTKRWCSGAAAATHGLLTAWAQDGRGPFLVLVDMAQPAVQVQPGAWCAVGMVDSQSVDVLLDGATARLCGGEGEYLTRPGFWQGGIGVAACWYGGCVALAEALRRADAQAAKSPPERRYATRVAVGEADMELRCLAALFREAAAWIDAHPADDAQALALRVRSAVDAAAQRLLVLAGRTLGATPYCRDRHFARLAADLPVFVRQTHADRDLAALGGLVAATSTAPSASPWLL